MKTSHNNTNRNGTHKGFTPRFRFRSWRLLVIVFTLTAVTSAHHAAAQGRDDSAEEPEKADPPPQDETAEQAKAHFQRGTKLTKKQRWADALAAFEAAARLRAHPVTSYNIGYCQRALGSYTLARRTFRAALHENKTADQKLSAPIEERIRGYLNEIERTLARYDVTLVPPNASLTVDGRPLIREIESVGAVRRTVFVAGVLPSGKGSKPGGRFILVVEPGAHVIQIRRSGFRNAIVKLNTAPGTNKKLSLKVDQLPAELKVHSLPPRAAIGLNGVDVGLTPMIFSRPAGRYHIDVRLDGYDPYSTMVKLRPGQHADVEAKLVEETVPLTSKWWFWTTAAAVVAGGVILTYALTRPDPEPVPYSGGGLGWVVQIP